MACNANSSTKCVRVASKSTERGKRLECQQQSIMRLRLWNKFFYKENLRAFFCIYVYHVNDSIFLFIVAHFFVVVPFVSLILNKFCCGFHAFIQSLPMPCSTGLFFIGDISEKWRLVCCVMPVCGFWVASFELCSKLTILSASVIFKRKT